MSLPPGHLELITTRDTGEARVATLEFRDRAPTADSAHSLCQRRDFVRGDESFLCNYPGASIHMRTELLSVGGEAGQLP